MTGVTLETDRLRLREWTDADLDPYAALCADPKVMRFIADGSPQDRERAAAAIASMRAGWDSQGWDLFCVARRDDDVCIGFAGLHALDFLPEVMPAVEIGWRLARSQWGSGYATEAALAARAFAFDTLGLDRLVSVAHADNAASINVMRKLGMSFDRATVHPRFGVPVVVYALAAG
ncbi:MAG: GNAT family N-acetyltransferase [Acidimicrobiia bacterium]